MGDEYLAMLILLSGIESSMTLGGARHDDCDSLTSPAPRVQSLRRPGELRLCATLPKDSSGETNGSAVRAGTGGCCRGGSVAGNFPVVSSRAVLCSRGPREVLAPGSNARYAAAKVL